MAGCPVLAAGWLLRFLSLSSVCCPPPLLDSSQCCPHSASSYFSRSLWYVPGSRGVLSTPPSFQFLFRLTWEAMSLWAVPCRGRLECSPSLKLARVLTALLVVITAMTTQVVWTQAVVTTVSPETALLCASFNDALEGSYWYVSFCSAMLCCHDFGCGVASVCRKRQVPAVHSPLVYPCSSCVCCYDVAFPGTKL